MNDDDIKRIDKPHVALEAKDDALESNLPEPGGEQTGEFKAEACIFLRHREGRIEALVQYEGDQYVQNPVNPEGDAVPDMSNPAVHFGRWVEVHLPALAQLSMGEFFLNKKLQTVATVKKRPALQLIRPDGGKLN